MERYFLEKHRTTLILIINCLLRPCLINCHFKVFVLFKGLRPAADFLSGWSSWNSGRMSDMSDMLEALYAAPGPPKTLWTYKALVELDELAEM